MESIIRNVRDIDDSDRTALERVVGSKLRENQTLVIQVINVDMTPAKPQANGTGLPDGTGLPEWCNVYEGMTDAEIEEIEKSIIRSPGGRTFD